MNQYKNLVRVNGHDINVYGAGDGAQTIVFLAGAMVTSPVLEYKSLWEKLTDTFRIAVVEKAGYGFSQGNTGAKRDVKTMVDETREALARAGIAPPYLVAAHSYSGIEAVYWAMQYPSEVRGILGLDMVTPSFALAQDKEYPAERKTAMVDKQNRVFGFLRKAKFLQKLYTALIFKQALTWKNGILTAEEREAYSQLFFRNICNPELREEQAMAAQNAQLVKNADLHNVPALLFISDMDIKMKNATWKGENSAYAKAQGWQVRDAKSHELYAEQPEEIAEAWKKFAEELGTESDDTEKILALMDEKVPPRPMVKLTPKRAEHLSVFTSKLGGVPYLPKDVPYPKGLSGTYENRPLRLLVQLNFSELPHIPDFPETGILQIFCSDDNDENVYGMDFDNGTNQNGFRVLYHRDIISDESQLITAADMPECSGESLFPFDGEFLLEASAPEQCPVSLNDYRGHMAYIDWCNAQRAKQVKNYYELYYDESEGSDALNEMWEKIAEMRENSGTHIGGYPYFTQEDPKSSGKYDEYDTLLFQCDSEYDKERGIDILWGDMGVANFFIPGEKLRQLDFSDVLFNWDCC